MEKWSIFGILLIISVAARATTIDWTKECKEGNTWKEGCHSCHCSRGKPACTRELCPSDATTNQTPTTTPQCNPGDKWVEDCNNCICDNEGLPECSRRLCA